MLKRGSGVPGTVKVETSTRDGGSGNGVVVAEWIVAIDSSRAGQKKRFSMTTRRSMRDGCVTVETVNGEGGWAKVCY